MQSANETHSGWSVNRPLYGLKLQRFRFIGADVEIELTRGKTTVIDRSAWPSVKCYKWYYDPLRKSKRHLIGYANAIIKRKKVPLHRFLVPGAKLVDHIDRNPLNNKRNNLRSVSAAVNNNNINKDYVKRNKSGVLGVIHHEKRKSFAAVWYEGGKKKSKCFSYGRRSLWTEGQARQLAIEHRNRKQHEKLVSLGLV